MVNLFFKNLIMYIQGSNVNPVQQRMDIGLHEIMSKANPVTPLCYLKNGRTARENERGTTPYFNKSEKRAMEVCWNA